MNNKKLVTISIVESILLVASLFANVYGFSTSHSLQFICNVFAILAAFAYAAGGYKKTGSFYFKFYTLSLAIKEAFALLNMAINENDPAIALIIVLLCYTSVLLLTVCLDLGKKKSYILAIIFNILSIITVIYVLVYFNYLSMLIYNITRLLLASVLFIMIYAKYEDKQARGTK